MSKTRVIGVLGTDATVRQPYVDRLSAEFASDCLVLRHGSARLVELAEAKLRGGAAAPAEYRAALEGLISQPGGDRMDTVVLACTHFPLVEDELRAASPQGLHFMHGGDRSEEQTSELQSLLSIPNAVFCLKKKTKKKIRN